MVQGTRIKQVITSIVVRIIAFGAALYASAYIPTNTLYFMENTLGYQRTSGFFGFTIEHLILALTINFIFWASIFFGALGKKIDYWIIGGFFCFSLLLFQGSGISMYLGLIGVAILGNFIGYTLKLARERWFGSKT